MPYTYRVDRQHNELDVVAEGVITLADIRAHLVYEEKALLLSYRELIDARRAIVGFSAPQVREIVHMVRTLSRRSALGPTAVVVSSDMFYGIMRMVQMLVEDVCIIQPFRDIEEAERWLRNWSPGSGPIS